MLLFGEDDKSFVEIASGQRQSIARAPAIASLITADDIRRMGATTLEEALESVPGLHVSANTFSYTSAFYIRGLATSSNSQVLVLVDGVPMTQLYGGNRGFTWNSFPAQLIARVEIIRGPASAVYGAEALAGVINVVTHASQGTNESVGVRAGSYDTYAVWVNDYYKISDWSFGVSASFGQTDGATPLIKSDAQSSLDRLFFTSASLAPGPAQLEGKGRDLYLHVNNQSVELDIGYMARNDLGTGGGLIAVIDTEGKQDGERIFLNGTYHIPSVGDWRADLSFNYMNSQTVADLRLLPPGIDYTFAGGDYFPEGAFEDLRIKENHFRIEPRIYYDGFDAHKLWLALGYYKGDMYEIREARNFIVNQNGFLVLLPGLVDVSTFLPTLPEQSKTVKYISVQDQWQMAADWELTTGVRIDEYSDFGTEVNPRLAIVWQSTYNITTKILYGHAFRSPSYEEQFVQTSPLAQGNDDLQPETIDTLELGVDYAITDDVHITANVFMYELSDMIRSIQDPNEPNRAPIENVNTVRAHGYEAELAWHISPSWNLNGNYAYQETEIQETGDTLEAAPRHKVYGLLSFDGIAGFSSSLKSLYVADRRRLSIDSRDEVKNYSRFDWIVNYENAARKHNVQLVIKNLLDKEYNEATYYGRLYLQDDLPMPGRSLSTQYEYRW
ncbi:MAG: TonB-dependent receptor [Gammaproteobacteria bacterium]|nr:TonB-dependent receptor [Gammaproteobacteria bacterium]